MLVFDEAVQHGADYCLPETGGTGDAGVGSDPADRDFGTNLLPLEEIVCGHGIRPSPGTEATGRGECAAQRDVNVQPQVAGQAPDVSL